MTKINLPEPQHSRNATVNFVNLIMTSTVTTAVLPYISHKDIVTTCGSGALRLVLKRFWRLL